MNMTTLGGCWNMKPSGCCSYAGLTSFAQLEPEIVKLDVSLVRGVDTDLRRQSIVRSMKTLCDQAGILVVAEGVETATERATLAELGWAAFSPRVPVR